jgi:hypothetical protein
MSVVLFLIVGITVSICHLTDSSTAKRSIRYQHHSDGGSLNPARWVDYPLLLYESTRTGRRGRRLVLDGG